MGLKKKKTKNAMQKFTSQINVFTNVLACTHVQAQVITHSYYQNFNCVVKLQYNKLSFFVCNTCTKNKVLFLNQSGESQIKCPQNVHVYWSVKNVPCVNN